MAITFTVNGRPVTSAAPEGTPLLWVLREELKLTGTKYGCGAGQCGACMVHIEGGRTFSCLTPVSSVQGRSVTTIEGLSPGRQPFDRGVQRAGQVGHHHRRAVARAPERAAARLARRERAAVRL